MATIYSTRNDDAGSDNLVSYSSASSWVGGVVPSPADTVYVIGRRTLINQGAFAKWAGTRTITVDSTSYFATAGYFYTTTQYGELVKIDYTGKTGTTFTGCSVNEVSNSVISGHDWNTYSAHTWNDGGNINDNTYVHNPANIIEINAGETFECDTLYIQEGGMIFVNGGTLKINAGIWVRDGRLIGRQSGVIEITRNSVGLSNSYVGYLNSENYPMGIIDIDGGENRSFTTLAATAAKDSSSITVNGTASSYFAIGDEITVYDPTLEGSRRWNKGYTGYRDLSSNFNDMDEGFDVCGVAGSNVYLATRNGARGPVKSVTSNGSTKYLNVDAGSTHFIAGDKILVNNIEYTISAVENSSHTLYDYDFTNPATSLSDFWVDDPDHVYSNGWEIESGVGLRNTGGYSELIHKYVWKRDVVVEAHLSPLAGWDSGTRGTTDYGILTSYDPSFRQGSRSFDSFKTDILRIDDASDLISFYIRSMSNYPTNRLSRDTSIRDQTRVGSVYEVDTREAFTTVKINGLELTKEFRRDGNFKGLVGIYTDANTSMRCRRLIIKIPTQILTITTTNPIAVDSMVYRTGTENLHTAGRTVLKIASINTGEGSHTDLAFAYRGQYGNGEWPKFVQVNGSASTSANQTYVHNHDMNVDYYMDLGNTTAARSMTIDLTYTRTFTHVSFVPRNNENSGFAGMTGVTIYGSNDLSSWTTLYGTTTDTKTWYGGGGSYNRIGFYPTGTASFRYVKFETTGSTGSANYQRYVNIGVHDFSEGYTLTLNNAVDFNIGDQITVSSDSGYSWASREYEGYSAAITYQTDPEEFFHGGWLQQCTITNKVGNKIYLDKPVWWGYVEGQDSVTITKINRNFKIQGTFTTNTGSTNDWRWPTIYLYAGSNTPRIYRFKNVRFNYIGSSRYSSSSDYTRGIRVYSYDYYNQATFDGNVHMMGPDGSTWLGVGSNNGNVIHRNSHFISMRSVWAQYNASYSGSCYYNNKSIGVLTHYMYYMKHLNFNFNEISTCDSGYVLSSWRVQRSVVPFFSEFRRNYIKGTSNSAMVFSDSESVGPRRLPKMKIEYNRVRASDDYSVSARLASGWPIVAQDSLAEHTGSRVSRYRNEGHVSQGDTSSDLSYVNTHENYGRFGYDVTFGVYHFLVRRPEAPETIEIYNPQGDDNYAMLGIEIEARENVEFQVHVKFDYYYSRLSRMQDDGNVDGRLNCYSLQHGTRLQTIYGEVPASTTVDGWNTFEGTFNTFASEEGIAAVYLSRDAQNSYIKIRNSSARVLTNSPTSLRVIGNTFNLQRIWDQYQEIKDMSPLTSANSRTVKLLNVKL